MLEVGRVVDAGREHRHFRLLRPGRRHGAQVLEQQVRIVLDRPDRLGGEKLREQAHHHAPVLEHVRHARGHAQVVLEHVVGAFVGAHQVDPGDVGVNAAGHVDALHLAPVLRIGQHAFDRYDPRLEDVLLVVDVVQEEVQRLHPLLEAPLQDAPLARRNDPRHEVERDQPLRARVLAVDREGDADAVEGAFRLLALLRDLLGRGALEPVGESLVMGPQGAIGSAHLIVNGTGHSGLIEHSVDF